MSPGHSLEAEADPDSYLYEWTVDYPPPDPFEVFLVVSLFVIGLYVLFR